MANLPFPKATVLSAVLSLMLMNAANAQAPATNMKQAVEQAILKHPEVLARYHDFHSSLEGQNVARGGLLPDINAQGWVGREYRSHLPEGGSSDWNRSGYTLELRQLLFDGFKTTNNIKQLGFEKLARYYELLAVTDSTAAEAVRAYLDVQRYRELGGLARENYALHNGIADLIRERSESGVGRRVDSEQATGRMALAQSNWMIETGNLLDVEERYLRIVGERAPATLEAPLDASSKLPVGIDNFSTPVLDNPSFLAKQALVQAARAGVEAARANFSPTLDVRASTGTDRDQYDQDRNVQSSRIQLMLSYNLYRGGADSARLRQTSEQTYAARDVRDYTCRNVQQELAIAWNNVARLRQQIPYLQTHQDATDKVREGYRQQFRIGQRSLMDLLNTEGELFDAQRALVNAQYDLRFAYYKWLSLAHQILPVLELAQPKEDELPAEEAAVLDTSDVPMNLCAVDINDTKRLDPSNVRADASAHVFTVPAVSSR